MRREDKLYGWSVLLLILAACFIESELYLVVAILALMGLLFGMWGYRVEHRHGR